MAEGGVTHQQDRCVGHHEQGFDWAASFDVRDVQLRAVPPDVGLHMAPVVVRLAQVLRVDLDRADRGVDEVVDPRGRYSRGLYSWA